MVEFGDEFIIESYRIPWLIWIQIFVMVLLVILLFFGFSIFDSDSSAVSSTSAAAAVPPPQLDKPSSSNNPRRTKKEDRKIKMDAGSSSGVSIREDETEDGESSMKDSVFLKMFKSPNHPCNFIGQCKNAFLKCLGLDSSPESSRNHSHDKQE